ncbi:MAG: EMC3/TMCO1 family protein [Thermoplasmata archaeon]|nr:EMC3/TMCO1 family protein [Thermoplasmata archaeon]
MAGDQTPLRSVLEDAYGVSDEPKAPLPSAPVEGPDDDDEDDDDTPAPIDPRPRPPAPTFKFSTMMYVFLGLLGLWMIIDQTARNQFATALGNGANPHGPLYVAIGFGSSYLLLTMAVAGAIEMLITAIAYNFTTDWVKQAKVQKWSQAFRKVQMAAVRSGKKDRIAALKPHQEKLARLSGEVSIAQFKGMAITYFLLVLIYTWVGLVISHAALSAQNISLNGASINLMSHVGGLPIPWWFLIFSLYTIPFSMVFRRVLKHFWIRRYVARHPLKTTGPSTGAVGGPA